MITSDTRIPKAAVDLESIAGLYKEATRPIARRIIICAGTGCVANGALKVYAAFVERIEAAGLDVLTELRLEPESQSGSVRGGDGGKASDDLSSAHEFLADVHVSKSGCQGFCQMGPLVTVEPDGILYTLVKEDDVAEIVEKTLGADEIIERLLYSEPVSGKRCKGTADIPFYQRQNRTVLASCGILDPEDICEYIALGGYASACKAYLEMTPESVCEEISDSGLRGRGGGGFPTGKKWDITRRESSSKKYVICNGDEGDPGAFMDRSVMEGNPHSVIEGMMIAARAIGADEGYIYVRAEYPLAVHRVRRAVTDAKDLGILGEDVFGSGQNLMIHVMEGAGAFVCGEETALIASIKGERGMPTPRPPYPAQSGLNGKPTVINNVETLATIPIILNIGAASFRKIGTEGSPGTKTFALTGHVANTGLIEVPFGTTLREIVYNVGGGVTDDTGKLTGEGFKAVQIGGPSGGCLTEEHLDLPLDFDSLRDVGAMVGSGGLVVMNKQTCMVGMARFFMEFTQNESCGKCVPCRVGTKRMLEMLNRFTQGEGQHGDVERLVGVAEMIKRSSLCGLGQTAPNPVLSTTRYFRDEYDLHVDERQCPAGTCRDLLVYSILQDLCIGCGACRRCCPAGAIHGKVKETHIVNIEKCIRCGACRETCKFNAIVEK